MYQPSELHWHKTAEWAYVLKGKTQVTAVDAQGKNYVATVVSFSFTSDIHNSVSNRGSIWLL